jgi:hypothetical protein
MSRLPESSGGYGALSPLSVVALVVLGLLWWARLSGMSLLERLTGWAAATAGWARLPWPLGLLTILTYRNGLRRENLHDTETAATRNRPVPQGERRLTARTADGAYNDLQSPRMGSTGTRFGRNASSRRTRTIGDRSLASGKDPRPASTGKSCLWLQTSRRSTGHRMLVVPPDPSGEGVGPTTSSCRWCPAPAHRVGEETKPSCRGATGMLIRPPVCEGARKMARLSSERLPC